MNFIKYSFYLFLLVFFLSLIVNAYPIDPLVYPEKNSKPTSNFSYNYIAELKIYYDLVIVNTNNDNRANFIGSTLNSFFELYFNNRKIIFDKKDKQELVSFFFNQLAIFYQNQRSINNLYNFKSTFFEDIAKKDFSLIKISDKEKSNLQPLILYEISYEYDFKSSKIKINCKKSYLFSNKIDYQVIYFDYKYLSFYNDFKNLFINKIMSFFLNQNFYKLEIELNSSAFIQIDGTVVSYFMDEQYPSIFEIVLEKGEHNIKVFEDGYYSYEKDIKLEKDEKISAHLNKKNAHCKVIIETFPAGSKVRYLNQFIGNSPISISLPAGNHFIIVSQDGYESKEIYISITEKEFEKKIYVYLMPVNTTQFYIDYSNKILDQVYTYFWNGCYGLAGAIVGSILYNYFTQFSNSTFYDYQTIGIYSSIALIGAGLITFAIFEILSLTELWKYYQFINYYTL